MAVKMKVKKKTERRVEEPKGNRIITDVAILGENISLSWICGFCNHPLKMYEVEKRGLSSAFSFRCMNQHCIRQQAFSSSPQILVQVCG